MFTGIIQNQAKVVLKKTEGGRIRLGLRFVKTEKRKIEMGESVAVDGTCLTVSKITKNGFEADVVRETLQATTLSQLKAGSLVNTERALRHGDPMGGHFVTGHVDVRGKILAIENKNKNRVYTFTNPPALRPFIAVKGSVVVDGISLTVQAVKPDAFKIAIVPHTWSVTTLGWKKAGDEVNLEADLIARYLGHMEEFSRSVLKRTKNKITTARLKAGGF
jgi:riboflavin synthase